MPKRREPLLPEDADLGIPVEVLRGEARHPLVTVGDSITMGFKSLAITDTSLSWPALLARALRLAPEAFTYPIYPRPRRLSGSAAEPRGVGQRHRRR
jgi:hypothetical protein